MKILYRSLSLAALLSPIILFGQQDSTTPQKRMLEAIYRSNINAASPLYNGPEYYYDDQLLTAHAFLETPTFEKGSITMDGVVIGDVPLAYDILRDELVTLSYGSDFKVKVVREKINGFTLRNTRLTVVREKSIPEGYYEVLHDGKTQLLARHEKRIKELTNAGRDVVYQVNSFTTYYLRTPNGYETIRDRSGLISALQDKKAELNRFIDSNRLSFSKELEEALIQSVRYYDQIKNQ